MSPWSPPPDAPIDDRTHLIILVALLGGGSLLMAIVSVIESL